MTCPSPFCFFDFNQDMISFTRVCFLISEFLILSLIVMLSILLSIALCAVISFCSSCLVVVHVSAPYVIFRITHWLYILLLRDIGSLWSQSISLNLLKQLHPAFILIMTSSHVWFSIITVWPRYLYLSTFSITSFSITMGQSDPKNCFFTQFAPKNIHQIEPVSKIQNLSVPEGGTSPSYKSLLACHQIIPPPPKKNV